jgi:hypothetical protein
MQMKKIASATMILAIIALMVSCSGGGKSPADVSKAFVTSIEKGNVDEAIKMLDGGDKASEEDMTKLKAFLGEGSKQIAEKGGIKNIEVVSEEISEDGKKADVKLKITYGNGETDDSSSNLILTDAGWKMTMEK